MKKFLKVISITVLTVILAAALFIAAWVYIIFPGFVAPNDERLAAEPDISAAAVQSEKIDFNRANGMLYINNEVIAFARTSASKEEIAALFASLDAEVDESMADIGIYRLIFKEAMSYDELEAMVKQIKSDPLIENAYINAVTEFEDDITNKNAAETEQSETEAAGTGAAAGAAAAVEAAETEDDFEYEEPVFPDDPWQGSDWNVRVPGGGNWGLEAIDAPGAWGYLDRIGTAKIGLIDSMPSLNHEDLTFADSKCLFIDENTKLTEINTYAANASDHGTHVSGTMNAGWNNGIGVSGVMGGKGELYYSAVYYAANGSIREMYATAYSYLLALKTLIDQDVQVINISQNTSRLIGFAASHGNQNAINYLTLQADLTEMGLSRIIDAREAAKKPDFLICVAAGNSNQIYYYKDDRESYGYREEMTTIERVKYLCGWRGEIGDSLALYNNFLNLMDAEKVKSRVIVVGAVGIDSAKSTSNSTKYSYASFSNVGSRVDIVAPGVDICSSIVNGYDLFSGTSMATPHVSGVAGLIFACNPSLSGPDVKEILVRSSVGRYYHGREYSGLLNARISVENALRTEQTPVKKVLKTETDEGLDLCFIVDTTGSMGDDIDNARQNMESILEHLADKTENYRVALIDYRDYPERTGVSYDYAYKLQLRFTKNNELISDAINELTLGDGGDNEETVYSALMAAVRLDWRSDAKKIIIILGDAAPIDPEPVTDYTYDKVLLALFNADISLDYEDSDDRVTDALDRSLINVFTIGTNASDDAADFFKEIAENTGGSYAGVDDASEVSDAIIDSIEQIEVDEKITVNADFGDAMEDQNIDLYQGDQYLFTLKTDESGKFLIDSIEPNTYRWSSSGMYRGGTVNIDSGSRDAAVRVTRTYWFTPLLETWHQHTTLICIVLLAYLAVCIAIPLLIRGIRRLILRRKPSAILKRQAVVGVCPNCGSAAEPGARFCTECGYELHGKGNLS